MFKLSVTEQVYNSIYQRMIKGDSTTGQRGVPPGPFYLTQSIVVPFSPTPTVFQLETDQFMVPVDVQAINVGTSSTGIDVISSKTNVTLVPTNQITTFQLNLGKGRNIVVAKEKVTGGREYTLIINATNYSTFITSYSREIFTSAQVTLDEQRRAIFSQFATRLMDPLLSFYDLLPDVQSLQILASKFISRALIHNPSTQIGVKELTTALSLCTPVLERMDSSFNMDPAVYPLFREAEEFAGVEAHVWIPNLAMANWLAFIKLVNNIRDTFKIIDVTEEEVTIEYQGEIQNHRFDFDTSGSSFLTRTATSDCFKSIIVLIDIITKLHINICAAAYTFDWWVTEDKPIGSCRLYFDSGKVLDSDCQMDEDPVDPFTDGWVGYSLTGRFEQYAVDTYHALIPLDSFSQPSFNFMLTNPKCSYPYGYYMQDFASHRQDVELAPPIDSSGYFITLCGLDGGGFLENDGGSFLAPHAVIDGGTFLAPLDSVDGGDFLAILSSIDGGTFLLPGNSFDGGYFSTDGGVFNFSIDAGTFLAPIAIVDSGTFLSPVIPLLMDGGYFTVSFDGGSFLSPTLPPLDGGSFLLPAPYSVSGGSFLFADNSLDGGTFLLPEDDYDAKFFTECVA